MNLKTAIILVIVASVMKWLFMSFQITQALFRYSYYDYSSSLHQTFSMLFVKCMIMFFVILYFKKDTIFKE